MAESGFRNTAKSWAKVARALAIYAIYRKKVWTKKIDWYVDERRDPLSASVAASKNILNIFMDYLNRELATFPTTQVKAR